MDDADVLKKAQRLHQANRPQRVTNFRLIPSFTSLPRLPRILVPRSGSSRVRRSEPAALRRHSPPPWRGVSLTRWANPRLLAGRAEELIDTLMREPEQLGCISTREAGLVERSGGGARSSRCLGVGASRPLTTASCAIGGATRSRRELHLPVQL